ncbi:DUF6220 domain-containing protein [Streptomyces sp. NK15101]|uniref:DUF6220 domain-containing protein n=1 Tax=Streptomyces sp. NK15101 TaxID=2873261 RepID=UPI001CECCF94|nr:DUF6220 domain-containing protein [Streptomyces sp. NK15101]
MRKAIAGLAAFIMLAIAVQFYLAGSGAFAETPIEEAFKPHRSLGYLIVLLSLVLTVLAAVARVPGRLVGMAGALVGLGILQPVIAVVAKAFDDPSGAGRIVFGLHAVGALAMVAVAVRIQRTARELSNSPASAAQATGPAQGSAQ